MKTKEIFAGNVRGYSSYQLAVLAGKFTGSLEEYLNKEMETYDQMVEYADTAKARIEELLASVLDSSENIDLSEVVHARGVYTLLGNRLDASDAQISEIIDRLNAIDPSSIGDSSVRPIGSNRNIELRNNGVSIQWRKLGESDWIDLVALDDMTPNLQIGKVQVAQKPEDATASITGTRKNPLLNLKLPKGKDGVDGGSIVNARINDEGHFIVTVKNGDEDIVVSHEGKDYLVPIITIGEVKTLEPNRNAYVTMTGSATNPVLNFGIPRGQSSKVSKGYLNDDGLLEFELE